MDKFDRERFWDKLRNSEATPWDICESLGIAPRTLGEWLAGESAPHSATRKALARMIGCDEDFREWLDE